MTSYGKKGCDGSDTVNYDEKNREISRIDGNGNCTSMKYDYMGNVVSVTDGRGNITTFTYDALGRLLTSTKANGNTTKYTYTVLDNVETKTEGEVTSKYKYFDNGLLKEEVISKTNQPTSYYTSYTYDLVGNVTSIEKGTIISGNNTVSERKTYSYDKLNLLTDEFADIIDISDSDKSHIKYEYDARGNVIGKSEYTGKGTNDFVYTTYTYDYAGNIIEENVDVDGKTVVSNAYAYDKNGNLILKNNNLMNGCYEKYVYDAKNRMTSLTPPMGMGMVYEYNSRDNITSVTHYRHELDQDDLFDILILTDGYVYDMAGNLTMHVAPEDQITTYTYDKAGNVDTVVEPYNGNSNTINYSYDPLNRLVQTKAVTNGSAVVVEKLTYDSVGNVTVRESGNIKVTTDYDAAGNPTTITDGEGNTTKYTYDGSGRILTMTDPNGNTTAFTYYKNGLPASVKYADGTETSYSVADFDYTGKYRITSRDRMNRVTLTENNYFGKPVKITYPDGMFEEFEYDSLGRMIKSKDKAGNEISYIYDLNGNLTKKTYKNKSAEKPQGIDITEEYKYYSDSLLLSYKDPEGTVTTYEYDEAGNLIAKNYPKASDSFEYDGGMLSSQTVNGISTKFKYDARGNVTAQIMVDSLEHTKEERKVEYEYDPAGNVTKQINPDKSTISYVYDKAGRLTEQTSGKSTTKYYYDANGNVTKQALNTNTPSVVEYTYDVLGNVVKENNNGVITTYEYDKLNRLVKVTLDGDVTQSFYNDSDNLYAVRNAKGQTTLYTYDDLGRLMSVADAVSDPNIAKITVATVTNYKNGNDFTKAMAYTYDTMGNKLTEKNVAGDTNKYSYDKRGRVLTVTVPGNKVVSTKTYDELGNLLTDKDANKNTVSYTYDNNRLTSVAVNGIEYKYYSYNAFGELERTDTPDAGHGTVATEYTYDNCGRIETAMVGPIETKYTYDTEGNMVSMTDGNGNETKYNYGPFGMLLSMTDAEDITETYEYDARGNLTRKIDGNGSEVSYAYDTKNNLTSMQYDGKITTYTYDALGNRTKMSDESGNYVYTYDNGNRLTKVTKGNAIYVTYEYDTRGNVTDINGTVYTYDECNRMKTAGDVGYTYDDAGNLKIVSTPVGTTTYTYDERNRVTKVENKVDNKVLSSYSYTYYNSNLEETKTDDKNDIVTTYEYTSAGQLSREEDSTRRYVLYRYDAAGNRITMDVCDGKVFYVEDEDILGEIIDGDGDDDDDDDDIIIDEVLRNNDGIRLYSATSDRRYFTETVGGKEISFTGKCVNYSYDKANRLKYVNEKFSDSGEIITKIIRYTFDDAGNQLSTVAEFLTPNAEGSEAYGMGYDSVVEVSINEYNGLHQLVNTTNIKNGERTFASYVYNGDGLRVQKTVDGKTTSYTYSGGYVIKETGATTKTYLRGLSYHGVTQGGSTYYYFCNAHGDVTGVVNSSGTTVATYEYDAFGNILEQTGDFDNDVRYSGEFYDSESENYYLRSRYYDPSIGRFTQQDSFLGFGDNPLSLNRYTYCHNNPVKYVDPSGFVAQAYTYWLEGEAYTYFYDDANMSEEQKAYIIQLQNNCHNLETFSNDVEYIKNIEASNPNNAVTPYIYRFDNIQQYNDVALLNLQSLNTPYSGMTKETFADALTASGIVQIEVYQDDQSGVFFIMEAAPGNNMMTMRVIININDNSIKDINDFPFVFINAESKGGHSLVTNGDYGVKIVNGKIYPAINVWQYTDDDGIVNGMLYGEKKTANQIREEYAKWSWNRGSYIDGKYVDDFRWDGRLHFGERSENHGEKGYFPIRNLYFSDIELSNDLYFIISASESGEFNEYDVINFKIYNTSDYFAYGPNTTPKFEYEVMLGANAIADKYSNLTYKAEVTLAQPRDENDIYFHPNTGSTYSATIISPYVYIKDPTLNYSDNLLYPETATSTYAMVPSAKYANYVYYKNLKKYIEGEEQQGLYTELYVDIEMINEW